MHFRLAFGALLIVTASVLPGLAQNRTTTRATYSISGNVRDDYDQREMESVRVELKQSTGTPINTTFTRGNGEFEFNGLPSGDYVIEIALQGYESFRDTFTIDNSARRGVLIFLRRSTTVANSNSGGTISAHELSVPRKAHDEYEKGLSLLYSKSDYKGAIVQFQRAIKDFPKFYEAYMQEGNAYAYLEQMGPAEEAMRKSVELSSNQYSDAFFQLAGLLNNAKRYSEAETFCRQGLALDVSSWHGHFEMARALSGLTRPEEAEKYATQARDLKPDNPPVYLVLANIHIHRQDFAALVKDLDGYLKIAPTGPEADQARKTRDEAQAAMKAQDQAQSKTQDQSRPSTHDQAGPGTRDQSHPTAPEPSQPNEHEPPLLPPLPPPEP